MSGYCVFKYMQHHLASEEHCQLCIPNMLSFFYTSGDKINKNRRHSKMFFVTAISCQAKVKWAERSAAGMSTLEEYDTLIYQSIILRSVQSS
jgi:hypothetical protein